MSARRAPEWLTALEYAHRGLHGDGVPENSLAAAEGAISAGMGIECDIQMSADNVPMVLHDWALERFTSTNGMVASRTADELEALNLLGTDQHPVRLSHLLDLIAGHVPLLIEIKSMPGYDVARSCAVVAQDLTDYVGEVAVMSFDPRVAAWFAHNAVETVRGLVGTDSLKNGFESVWRQSEVWEQAQPEFLAIDVRDLFWPEAAAWRETGRPLLTWTVRSPETRAAGLSLADALIAEGAGLS